MIKFLLLALSMTVQASPLDDGILIADQKTKRILILEDGKDWNKKTSILWKWDIGKSPLRRLFVKLNDAKRVFYQGRDHILICGNGGDGVALIDVETKEVVWWTNAGGDPHTAALLPDGNVVVSLPRRGGVALFDGSRNDSRPIQMVKHNGTHGLIWDDENQILWSWGGSFMRSLAYEDGRLSMIKSYRIPDGRGGGHDVAPKLGTRELFISHNGGVSTFNVDTKQFEHYTKVHNPKGISYRDSELIYTIPDREVTGMSSRTHRVRSTTQGDRMTKWGGFYKARFYQHNSFSYPSALD